MEKTLMVTQCDVCGRKVKKSYYDLHNNSKWHKYMYGQDWTEGCHSGIINISIIVCDKCDNNRKGIKYFFHKLLKPFVTSYNKDCAVTQDKPASPKLPSATSDKLKRCTKLRG